MNPHREALQLARAEIEKGTKRYICYALDNVVRLHPHLAVAVWDLRERVEQELAPNISSLDFWLLNQDICVTDSQRQLARLAWIDRMLEDYP